MKIHELPGDPGRQQKTKRLGRGEASGVGKTSGKGHKGHKARSGGSKSAATGFEGGQVPLYRRLPKRGFHNPFRKEYEVVNLSSLEKSFPNGTEVTIDALRKARLASGSKAVKVLGTGELKKKLTVHAHAFSGSAKEKIEKAGGSAVALSGAPKDGGEQG